MASNHRSHHVCVSCRVSWKRPAAGDREIVCPRCTGPLIDVGTQFAAPPRRDTASWRALTAVLAAGLRFWPTCMCCEDGPGYRPRTPREVRERLTHALATGVPVAQALACPDPSHADVQPRQRLA